MNRLLFVVAVLPCAVLIGLLAFALTYRDEYPDFVTYPKELPAGWYVEESLFGEFRWVRPTSYGHFHSSGLHPTFRSAVHRAWAQLEYEREHRNAEPLSFTRVEGPR